MITTSQFLQIIEKNLLIDETGAIVIKDPKLARKYSDFLAQTAKKQKASAASNTCTNVGYCPSKLSKVNPTKLASPKTSIKLNTK